jgi:hypothetical protein
MNVLKKGLSKMSSIFKVGFVGLLCVIGIAILCSLAAIQPISKAINQAVITDNHSHPNKHMDDPFYTTSDVEKCFKEKGPLITFQEGNSSKFLQLCMLNEEGDKFGLRVFRKTGSDKLNNFVWRYITAYWKQELTGIPSIVLFILTNNLHVVNIVIK